MSGVAISIHADTKGVERRLGEMIARGQNLTPALKMIGETIRSSVIRNFEKQGRPKPWKPHAPATVKKRGAGAAILQKSGQLKQSINWRVTGNRVEIGTNKIYAAIHQLGGRAGRGRKVRIPARPFLMVQDEDRRNIEADLLEYFLNRKR